MFLNLVSQIFETVILKYSHKYGWVKMFGTNSAVYDEVL